MKKLFWLVVNFINFGGLVYAQNPQVLTNVQEIRWGSGLTSSCDWIFNPGTGAVTIPCVTTGGAVTLAGDATGPSGSNTVSKINNQIPGLLPLSGDVTGTLNANTVTKVNNGTLPISSPYIGTDSLGKLIVATPPTGSGIPGTNIITSTTGMIATLNNCGATFSCSIVTPPNYNTLIDTTPGYSVMGYYPNNTEMNPTIYNAHLGIQNLNFGDWRMYYDPRGSYNSGPIGDNISAVNYFFTHWFEAPTVNSNYQDVTLNCEQYTGGFNSNYLYGNKNTYTCMGMNLNGHSRGQHITYGNNNYSYGLGDISLGTNFGVSMGGWNAATDQGAQFSDNQIIMGQSVYGGNLTTGGVGLTTLAINNTTGTNTQGEGRWIINETTGVITTSATALVSSQAANIDQSTTVMTVAATLTPAEVVGTLGTSVITGSNGGTPHTPLSVTVTPNITTGTLSLLTTAKTICISDRAEMECVKPTAVNSGGGTFTYLSTKTHPSTAIISEGGVTGYMSNVIADNISTTSFNNSLNNGITYPPLTNSIKGIPIQSNTANTITIWLSGGGDYHQYQGFLCSSYTGSTCTLTATTGIKIYPAVEALFVTTIAGSNPTSISIGNNITVAQNNITWNVNDFVEQLHYWSVEFGDGQNFTSSFIANHPDAANGPFARRCEGLCVFGDLMQIGANTPLNFFKGYNGGLSTYTPMNGLHITSPNLNSLLFDYWPEATVLSVGCYGTGKPCTSRFARLAAFGDNNGSNSIWFWDMLLSTLTMNSDNGMQYKFGKGTIGSNVSANTDLVGELTFASATTATYTLIGGTSTFGGAQYSVHPECTPTPQFDPGTGNRMYITYSGVSSFTINFTSAVTGIVGYSCLARN